MKTFVINLKHRVDRRIKTLALLDGFPNLDVEVCEAIYGKTISSAERSKLTAHFKYNYPIPENALGCALSHRKSYEMLLQTDAPYALVVEDDLLVSPLFAESIDSAAEMIQRQTAPCVILFTPHSLYARIPKSRSENLGFHKVYESTCAVAYMINRAGARFMLEKGNPIPIRYIADHWYFFIRKGLKVFACVPHTVSYSNDRTDSDLLEEHYTESARFKTVIKPSWPVWRRFWNPQNIRHIRTKFNKRLLFLKYNKKTW